MLPLAEAMAGLNIRSVSTSPASSSPTGSVSFHTAMDTDDEGAYASAQVTPAASRFSWRQVVHDDDRPARTYWQHTRHFKAQFEALMVRACTDRPTTPSVSSDDSFWDQDAELRPRREVGGWRNHPGHSTADIHSPCPAYRKPCHSLVLWTCHQRATRIPQPFFSLGSGRPRPGFVRTSWKKRCLRNQASRIPRRVF